MSKFFFLVNTSYINKPQRAIVNICGGLFMLIGIAFFVFGLLMVYTELPGLIGVNPMKPDGIGIMAGIGLFFCGIGYLLVYALSQGWKKKVDTGIEMKRLAHDMEYQYFGQPDEEIHDLIQSVFKKEGIITMTYMGGWLKEKEETKKIVLVNCRHAGPLRRGGDYTLVIVKGAYHFPESTYLTSLKKAQAYLSEQGIFNSFKQIMHMNNATSVQLIKPDLFVIRKLHHATIPQLKAMMETGLAMLE